MLDSDEGQFPNSIHFDLKLGQSPKPCLESSQWTRLPPIWCGWRHALDYCMIGHKHQQLSSLEIGQRATTSNDKHVPFHVWLPQCLGNFYFNISNSSFTFRSKSCLKESINICAKVNTIAMGSKIQTLNGGGWNFVKSSSLAAFMKTVFSYKRGDFFVKLSSYLVIVTTLQCQNWRIYWITR